MWFPYIWDVVNVSADQILFEVTRQPRTGEQSVPVSCRLYLVRVLSEVTRAAPYFVVLRLMLMMKTFIFDI